jgi:hypothetical protein
VMQESRELKARNITPIALPVAVTMKWHEGTLHTKK